MISAEDVGMWPRCWGPSESTGGVLSHPSGLVAAAGGWDQYRLVSRLPAAVKARLWCPRVPGHISSTPNSVMVATVL